jgi:uncharacterized membrane protein YbaN (DUF454 family)
VSDPKETLQELEQAEPGKRFQQLYEKRQRSPNGNRKNVAFVVVGLLVIAVGIATYPVPVIPSEIVIVIGLALLSQGSRRGAVILDGIEVRLRRWLAPAIKVWKRWPKWAKVTASIAWMALLAGLSYWAYTALGD